MNLSTKYMGLELKNPLIVSSSTLTSDIEKIAELEKNGAGAVILRSLFEEQIIADTEKMLENVDTGMHAEAFDLFSKSTQQHMMDEYLKLVEEAGKRLSIPVIASINCTTAGKWIEYAKMFEKVGARGLELNVFIQPHDLKMTSEELEKMYISIMKKVKKEIAIPVAMKISSHFTGLTNVIDSISKAGADAVVMFNRYYRVDIDIEELEVTTASMHSVENESELPLKWIALLAGKIKADLSSTTGIYDYKDVIKQILAGATTVQLCSTIYQNGPGQIAKILDGIEKWMEKHSFTSVDDFTGRLSAENEETSYRRTQYIKTLSSL